MKRTKISCISETILFVLMGLVMVSCENKDEWLGSVVSYVYMYIEDEAGNDLVSEWNDIPSSEKKMTYDRSYVCRSGRMFTEDYVIHANQNSNSGKYYIRLTQDHASVSIGDSVYMMIKLFDADESFVFGGEYIKNPKPRKDSQGQKILYDMQWTFDGTVFPIANPTSITLIRSSEGKYTLKSAD